MNERLELIDAGYLSDFLAAGGGSVKFAVNEPEQLALTAEELEKLATGHGYVWAEIDAAETKINRSDTVSSGTRRGGTVFLTLADDGYERRYYGIRFQREEAQG